METVFPADDTGKMLVGYAVLVVLTVTVVAMSW